MTSEPSEHRPATAEYQANPTLKRAEYGFESLLFNSRWLMAPFYLGLVVSTLLIVWSDKLGGDHGAPGKAGH